MRTLVITGFTSLVLALSGCSSYNQVNQGWEGATSPAESGQHGAYADQAAPYGSSHQAKSEHDVRPIEHAITNGETDPSMEGSGNIAAQGDYNQVVKQQQNR